MKDEIKINQKLKDNVFNDLFSNKENILELFKEISPKDYNPKITVNSIKILNLPDSLINSLHSDLAANFGDMIIIVTEAQTFFKENDVARFAGYAFEALGSFFRDNLEKLHSTKKLRLPKIRVYVLYCGNQQNIQPTYSLRELFFDGDKEMPDIQIRVLFPNDKEPGGIANQYMLFCTKESQFIAGKKFRVKREEFLEFLDHCIKEGILPEYLKKHKSEVTTMLSNDLAMQFELRNSREEGIDIGMKRGIEEGMERGIKKGIEEGMKEGIKKGKKEGKEEGIDIGMERGIKKGKKEGADAATIETLKSLDFSKEEASQYLERNKKLDPAEIQELIQRYWNGSENSKA